MKSSIELIDEKEQLRMKAETLLNNAQTEQRKLTEDEQNEFVDIRKQMENLDEEIRQINESNTKEERKINKTMGKFSLLKAINDVANNRQLDERAMEIVNEGIAEMRKSGQNYSGQIVLPVEERADVQATVATQGQEVVAEDKLNILEPLRDNNVLVLAGATYMTGLVGNVSIPTYTGSNVNWAGEVAAASDGAGTFDEVTLEPHRLTAFVDVSKQFLIQDSASAEAMLKADIVNAINDKLQSTILGDTVIANAPAPLFDPSNTMNATFSDVVAMEQDLEDANVYGDFKFIVSPAIKATMKTTEKSAGTAKYIMENGEIDGLPVLSTSASAGIALGKWSELVIAQWGGIDLTVDPYTQAANGKVRLVINAYFDAKPRRPEAIVAYEI